MLNLENVKSMNAVQQSECLNPCFQNTSKIIFGSLLKTLAAKKRAHYSYTNAL